MKNYLFLFLSGMIFLNSCNPDDGNNPKPNRETRPTEPCKNVSWASFPVITHGYKGDEFDTVIVKTYIKNSHFDSLVSAFIILNNRKIEDKEGQTKSFSMPKEVTSNFDLWIEIGKRDHYKITEVQTDWIPRMCQSFCGYECTITTFLVNGQREGGNISLKNPDFEYPDESLENIHKRTELKAASNYTQDGWAEL